MSAESGKGSPVELEAEQEVDFGRYWRAIVGRWWLLVIGAALGALIGFVVALSGGKMYKATAQVYLGQPLAPDNSSPVTSAPTTLGIVIATITGEESIRTAAASAGLRPGKLRNHVTARAIPGASTSKQAPTVPLLSISVTGSSRVKTAAAANALAKEAVQRAGSYSDTKVATLQAQLKYIDVQLAIVNARVNSAHADRDSIVSDKTLSATEKLVALTNLNSEIDLAETRQAALELNRFNTERAISLATDIEQSQVTTPAVAQRIAPTSRRTSVVIGAFIGFLLGIIAALAWDPVAARTRPTPV
jgi:hypothetical protein